MLLFFLVRDVFQIVVFLQKVFEILNKGRLLNDPEILVPNKISMSSLLVMSYLYCYFLEEITISLNYCLICLYKRSLFLFYYRIFNTFWKKTCFFWIQVVWFPLFKFQHSREICKQCFRSILCQQILINWGKKLIKQNNTSSFVLNVTSLLYKAKCILAR